MAVSRLQLEKSSSQIKQKSVCSFCHNMLDPNALFCDICGTPHDISHVYQIRSEMQQNVDTLNITLQSLENQRAFLLKEMRELESSLEKTRSTQRAELESLESKRKTLTEGLQPLTVEVESLANKKHELTNEIEALLIQVRRSEIVRKSEEATIEHLRRERLELEHGVKRGAKKNSRAHRMLHEKKLRGIKKETHTFICKYAGKEDWNTELAKRTAQFDLTLDPTTYSVSPEKIAFSVKGSRDNIEKLAAALNDLEGFVNLRSKLANTKRALRESIEARNVHKEQLNALNKAPWYRRNAYPKSLATQKAELSQELSADDLKIKALTEDLKTMEDLLGSDESTV